MLYFFLSYARGDDDDFVQKFYRDLSAEVRGRSGHSRNQEVGFLDLETIRVGDVWKQRIDDALSSCSCFIALCTPRYFLSEFCGKEWAVFASRLIEYEMLQKKSAGALLPIMWHLPMDQVHPVAAAIQYRGFGRAYSELGLGPLIKLKRYADYYQMFLYGLADRIIETARNHHLPPPPRGLADPAIHSVFTLTSTSDVIDDVSEQSPANNGNVAVVRAAVPPARLVHFVVAAGGMAEVSTIPTRTQVDFYGTDHRHWKPYRPIRGEALATYAGQLAAERQYASTVVGVDNLLTLIRDAGRQNQIVILLVDAWATYLSRHRTELERYDAAFEPTTGVLIPFSTSDAETISNSMTLYYQLRMVFRRHSQVAQNPMFRPNIPNCDSFADSLNEMLEEAQNRIFMSGNVHHGDDPDEPPPRPILGEP